MVTLTLFSAPESCEGTVVAGAERNVGQTLATRGARALSAYLLHHGCVQWFKAMFTVGAVKTWSNFDVTGAPGKLETSMWASEVSTE